MDQPTPRIEQQSTPQGQSTLVLGQWTAAQFAQPQLLETLEAGLTKAGAAGRWDLTGAEQIDHVGGQLLWDHWARKWPEPIELLPAQRAVLERVAQFTCAPPSRTKITWRARYLALGGAVLRALEHVQSFMRLIGELTLNLFKLARAPQWGRGATFPATCTASGQPPCRSRRWSAS
jgi:phospholipid/cholesterol/gamma-HCH transport system permease protein